MALSLQEPLGYWAAIERSLGRAADVTVAPFLKYVVIRCVKIIVFFHFSCLLWWFYFSFCSVFLSSAQMVDIIINNGILRHNLLIAFEDSNKPFSSPRPCLLCKFLL